VIEEMTTVNSELKEKVDEVSRTNSDLQNLMAAIDVSSIFLDLYLRIKRFTSPFGSFSTSFLQTSDDRSRI
jgi:two-component system CheB/CheR fusion protein